MFWLNQAHAAGSTFMPVQGSNFSGPFDTLYSFLLWASLISCVLVVAGAVWFAFRYRRQGQKSAYISHNAMLEFAWSFIPFLIFLVVFAWGWWIFHDMRNAPKGALEVHVEAKMWSWDFLYKSGRRVSQEAVVPVGTPVKLIMTSQDVLHSFFIPAFRIKQDVVPGRYTMLWFEATQVGDYHVFCTEYCGQGHSAMLAKIKVLPVEEYNQWLLDDPFKGLSLEQIGQNVFNAQCIACHNLSAEAKIGPGFQGLIGSQRNFEDGSTVTADENYIRESILNPNAKIVKGFPSGVMPTFQGQLQDQEISGLIEYMKTLR